MVGGDARGVSGLRTPHLPAAGRAQRPSLVVGGGRSGSGPRGAGRDNGSPKKPQGAFGDKKKHLLEFSCWSGSVRAAGLSLFNRPLSYLAGS